MAYTLVKQYFLRLFVPVSLLLTACSSGDEPASSSPSDSGVDALSTDGPLSSFPHGLCKEEAADDPNRPSDMGRSCYAHGYRNYLCGWYDSDCSAGICAQDVGSLANITYCTKKCKIGQPGDCPSGYHCAIASSYCEVSALCVPDSQPKPLAEPTCSTAYSVKDTRDWWSSGNPVVLTTFNASGAQYFYFTLPSSKSTATYLGGRSGSSALWKLIKANMEMQKFFSIGSMTFAQLGTGYYSNEKATVALLSLSSVVPEVIGDGKISAMFLGKNGRPRAMLPSAGVYERVAGESETGPDGGTASASWSLIQYAVKEFNSTFFPFRSYGGVASCASGPSVCVTEDGVNFQTVDIPKELTGPSPVSSWTLTSNVIEGDSPADFWMLGDTGSIGHFDGKTWTIEKIPSLGFAKQFGRRGLFLTTSKNPAVVYADPTSSSSYLARFFKGGCWSAAKRLLKYPTFILNDAQQSIFLDGEADYKGNYLIKSCVVTAQ